MKRCLRVCVLTVLMVILLAGASGAAVFADDTEAAGFVTADNKKVLYINEANFPDPVLREYLSQTYDFFESKGYITWFDCMNNVREINLWNRADLKSLQGIEYFEALEEINVYGTGIVEIDVSRNPNLRILVCAKTSISEIDVSKNAKLESLIFFSTPVKEIDISANPELIAINCTSTDLTSLDTSKNPKLGGIVCVDTAISQLDIRNNPALYTLHLTGTGIRAIDISEHIHLKSFSSDDILYGGYLDLSRHTKLKELVLWGSDLLALTLPEGFDGELNMTTQEYSYKLDPDEDHVDLKDLVPDIDGGNIINVEGAVLDGTILKDIRTSGVVSYEYVCDPQGYEVLEASGKSPAYLMKVRLILGKRSYFDGETGTASMKLDGSTLNVVLKEDVPKRLAALIAVAGESGSTSISVNIKSGYENIQKVVLAITSEIYRYFGGSGYRMDIVLRTDIGDYRITADQLDLWKSQWGEKNVVITMENGQQSVGSEGGDPVPEQPAVKEDAAVEGTTKNEMDISD